MLFEERDLKPYAEPVSANELKKGSIYFSVTFIDENMHIPVIETLVYVGKDDNGLLLFQNVESYRQGVCYDSATGNNHAAFFQTSEDQLNAIFEYEHALDELMRCLLRRQENV